MKRSDKTTANLLVKAYTDSEWDSCDFAIIHITQDWKKELQKRIESVSSLKENYYFQSANYSDAAVNFFTTKEDDLPDIEELLRDQCWAFVELEENELESFAPPQSRLDSYGMVLRADGRVTYSACGKYTGEEFWTEEIPIIQLTK